MFRDEILLLIAIPSIKHISFVFLTYRKKNKNSPKDWFNEIIHNSKRLGRLILRGNSKKIFFPNEQEGKNNLQRMVAFSKRLLNNTLKATLNKTTSDVVEIAKNTPKDLAKNLICLTPNIILKVRQMNSKKDPDIMERRFLHDIKLQSGNI